MSDNSIPILVVKCKVYKELSTSGFGIGVAATNRTCDPGGASKKAIAIQDVEDMHAIAHRALEYITRASKLRNLHSDLTPPQESFRAKVVVQAIEKTQ
ncbi:uncharacterized protein PHALS_03223 [Plasmopara halstedii]|uniref:Uncharacterized protein n=1 Tax=Plasmopara halstedii TaxID=4781 RepID=A0A0P1B0C2_PLAHL|nr:uncharacterized protein PHALS_03223 [Plasmopara halstedii]CEG46625.1 hypothetical protein PHALS_03223 [Plasmopara halstedii]|eukprot:XP_024582994.1 hypothetical protein PHALS_03223 [Plasmopara halstedii]